MSNNQHYKLCKQYLDETNNFFKRAAFLTIRDILFENEIITKETEDFMTIHNWAVNVVENKKAKHEEELYANFHELVEEILPDNIFAITDSVGGGD